MEGNYWSDFNGIDENNDGISDVSYTISDGHYDYFPLIEPHNDTYFAHFGKEQLSPTASVLWELIVFLCAIGVATAVVIIYRTKKDKTDSSKNTITVKFKNNLQI